MPATVKPTLKPEAAADKAHAVRIRVTSDRVVRYYDTGIRIAKTHWNPKATYEKENWVKNSHPESEHYNTTLRFDIDGLKAISQTHRTFTADEILLAYKGQISGVEDLPSFIAYSRKSPGLKHKEAIATYLDELATGRSRTGFIAFFRTYIARKHAIKKDGTAENYETKLNVLLRIGEGKPEAELLTSEFAHHAQAAMVANSHEPGYINDVIRSWHFIFNKAMPAGHVPQMVNPFDIERLPVPEKKTERPDSDIIKQLQELPLKRQTHVDARNTFLLQFFLHGARVSEALKLRWEDVEDDHIRYLPGKRAKRIKTVPRNEALNSILDYYRPNGSRFVLPYVQDSDFDKSGHILTNTLRGYTRRINHALGIIGGKLGLKLKLTTHKIRHTFADVVLEATNDLREAQELIGHGSIQSTEIYAKRLEHEKVAERSKSIYEKFQ